MSKDDLEWLHRFINCAVFGPPPSECQRAHMIVDELEASPEYVEIGYLLKNEYGFVSAHVPNLAALPVGQTTVYSSQPQRSESSK